MLSPDTFIPFERVLVAYDPAGQGKQITFGWNPRVQVVQSDNFFETTKTLIKGGNRFLLSKWYFFIAKLEKF